MTSAPTRIESGRQRHGEPDDANNRESNRANLQEVRRDLSKLKADASTCAAEAAENGMEAIKSGAAQAVEAGQRVSDLARDSHERMRTYVSANPTTSVLIAVGVGALLARILPRG